VTRPFRNLILVGLGLACGCGGTVRDSAAGRLRDQVRFHNRVPVVAVNDRADTPEPKARRATRLLYHYDGLVHRKLTRAIELRTPGRAKGVNSLDEVPDSTWFENRIGVRDLSVDEIRRGPNRGPGPMAYKPWKILSSKIGKAAGFIIEDTRGDKYLLKFDKKGAPEMESGAHIIAHRLLWALGYRLPEDRLVSLARADLVVTGESKVEDAFGHRRPMNQGDVDRILSRAELGDGRHIRALVSKFIPGKPLGGFSRGGTRRGDPNDLIPHERRRDLRGLFPVFAWLKHTDVKEGNTLDAWVKDPVHPGRHYIVHYQIDFGKALGVMTRQSRIRSDGYARLIDGGDMGRSLLSMGLWKHPWDEVDGPAIRGVGILEVEAYDPGTFRVRSPYWPLEDADRFDKFWGAKLLMRLTPAQIRAAVEEARYSDPRASDYLARQLIRRQRKTAYHWFQRVNPLDEFAVRSLVARSGRYQLCFSDLLLKYRLAPQERRGQTAYFLQAYGDDGRATGWSEARLPDERGRICLDGPLANGSPDGYTIVEIETRRPGSRYRPVLLHLAHAPATGAMRIIGLRRL
jgi:hypothetical protein